MPEYKLQDFYSGLYSGHSYICRVPKYCGTNSYRYGARVFFSPAIYTPAARVYALAAKAAVVGKI